eukprot:g1740.t1
MSKETATAYMKKHGLQTLMDELVTLLVFNRPSDPKQFIINELKLRIQKKNKPFFTETDLKAMFGMFDRTGSGTITSQQVNQAVATLGARDITPPNVSGDIDVATFVDIMTSMQRKMSG